MTSLRIVVLLLIGLSIAPHRCAAAPGSVELGLLSKGAKITPLVWSMKGRLVTTDVKLPVLTVTNAGRVPASLLSLCVRADAGGVEVARYFVAPRAVVDASRPVVAGLALARDKGQIEKARPLLALSFGQFELPGGKLVPGTDLGPGESTILLLSSVLHVQVHGQRPLDRLSVTASFRQGGAITVRELPLPLTPFVQKNRYVFPVRGRIGISNLPLNPSHHRAAASQEFGMDIVGIDPAAEGPQRTSLRERPRHCADYAIFRRDILAAADGTVITVVDGFPDDLADQGLTDPKEQKRIFATLEPRIGFLNTVAGNHVVIDHGNGEYSFYAHISQRSSSVRPGDRVRRGDVIARVGQTGNSSEPHLHFQLMDSPDMLTANGLPVAFDDVPPELLCSYLEHANSLTASDNVILQLPAPQSRRQ